MVETPHKQDKMSTTRADLKSTEHMDDLASAAGLMQLSSAAMAADAADAGSNNDGKGRNVEGDNSNSSSSANSTSADGLLPPGWQRIIHGSGLPCYMHDGLGVVCWTRPYPLDVGSDGTLSQPELHRLVKQHVPPLSIFAPGSDVFARRRKESLSGDSVGAGASLLLRSLNSQEPSSAPTKKRKLDTVIKEQKGSGKHPSMTLGEFKMLSIGDPRVLQACMELSIKTPAQVLQEYQNRNRGVSINYNTVPVEGDGVKLFKTIVTAGSTVAEGIASTKKIAKQLGAQQLLAMLHERTARNYYDVAELYNSSIKGQPVITESSTYGPSTPLRHNGRGGRGGNRDPRLERGGNAPNRNRRGRRSPPNQQYDIVGGSYRDYGADQRVNPYQTGYNQQPAQQQAVMWNNGNQQGDIGSDRVVVYSQTPDGSSGVYGDNQYYANAGGNAWGSYPNLNHPVPQANLPGAYPPQQQYNGAYGDAQPYGYGNYHSRAPNRSNTSTPIERVTANLRNQMSNH
eukprot:jgi/Phyca11/551744/estExt2_Genewise1Plus.C_PHYCAscaffold_430230